ncbi:MAG: hypothetical protein OXC40_07660 [Proteobacteria bacterium]|nr:hypothetical protein [Pseudomonadota bacterium]
MVSLFCEYSLPLTRVLLRVSVFFLCYFLRYATLLLALVSYGCMTHSDKMASIKEAISFGQLAKAEKLISESGTLGHGKGKNRLLFFLEQATLYHHQKQYKLAEKSYMKASALIDELYTKSLSQGALSFVVNDSTIDYAGEDYEIIALHTMMALMYIEGGSLSKAHIEARRINTRLRELLKDEEATGSYEYHRDAFALYLSGLIFEANKNYDSAIIDYRRALETYDGGYQGGTTPNSLIRSLYLLAKQQGRSEITSSLSQKYQSHLNLVKKHNSRGGVIVLAKGYPSVGKVSQSFVFALGDQIIRYAWPVIPNISVPFPEYDFQIKKQSANVSRSSWPESRYRNHGELVQDHDRIARSVLEKKRLSLTAKSLTRLVAKGAITHELHQINPLLGVMANLIGIITETADTRSWSTLPGKIMMERYFLEPGQSYIIHYRSPGALDQRNVSYHLTPKKNELYFIILDYTRPHITITPKP